MKVAIFGAGTMGSGIAQVFAAKGHTALMYASSVASAQKHKDKLAASLAKRVAKGKMTQEAVDALLANILVEEAPRHRYALLQSRSQHEAGGDHPRCQHHSGDLRRHLQAVSGDRQGSR